MRDYMAMIPMPEWTSAEAVGEYLRAEFRDWIYYVWQEIGDGRPVPGNLMQDLTTIASAAGEFLATGNRPELPPISAVALADLANEALTFLDYTDPLKSKEGMEGEYWPLFVKSLARGLEQLAEQKPVTVEVAA